MLIKPLSLPKYLKTIVIVSLLCICTVTTMANKIQLSTNTKVFQLPNIAEKIIVDGNITEAVWQQALIIELKIETRPGENIAAPVETLVYMYEDGENLNVAFIANDPEPSLIRAHYHDHDYIFDDDTVGFKVDTFNDDLRAYQFFVNALGVKHDSIEDDVLRRDDLSWNAIWDAASKITAQGFQAEFSIPLRILRFDDSKPVQIWGFDVLRFYPREVLHRISHQELDRNISCGLCQNARLKGLKNVTTGNNLTIVPFLTTTQISQRENPAVDPWDNQGAESDFGIDIRWGVTADTTLNATINPDFSQVESDVAQLDINNTFSLFYPEKRAFFLEGADYYQTLVNLVHTRNVSAPDYGIKLTHSSNGNNYAAFLANDSQTNYILPGSSRSDIASYDADSINGVFRYRRDFENTSSLGVIFTLREADQYHNYVYGIDGLYRFSDTDVLRGQILRSDTQDPEVIVNAFSLTSDKSTATAVDLHYRHAERDWLWWGRYKRYDAQFRADFGFLPEVDYKRYIIGFRRHWYTEKNKWWHKISSGLDWRVTHDISGKLLGKLLNASARIEGSLQSAITLTAGNGETFWDGIIYPNNYRTVDANFKPLSNLSIGLFVRTLDSVDYENSQSGKSFQISPSMTYNLGEHLQTTLRYTKITMDVTAGELFDSSLLDARFVYQFSVRSFLRLIIQYSETIRDPSLYREEVDANKRNLGTQLLYSYKINQQTVFFLGYSDSSFRDDSFNQLKKTGKTLFMKMSYSWLY